MAQNLIKQNKEIDSSVQAVTLYKNPRFHIDPKVNEDSMNKVVNSYNSYQAKVEKLTSRYSNYKEYIDNKTESLKNLIFDQYHVSKEEASTIATKIVNGILDLSRTDTNKIEIYSRKYSALRNHLSSLESLRR